MEGGSLSLWLQIQALAEPLSNTPAAAHSQKATWQRAETKIHTFRTSMATGTSLEFIAEAASSQHCFWSFLTTSLTQGRLLDALPLPSTHFAARSLLKSWNKPVGLEFLLLE